MDHGEEFGPYRLRALLGRGGMGEVFEAHDTVRQRDVAVKRLLAHMVDDTDFRARFEREARTAARLRNPHVVPIHTYGDIDGRLFLDMRLVVGYDLHRVLATGEALDPVRAATIVGQVASALDSAHREGLVHRDVKPSNILLDRDVDDEDFVYLADFGITRPSNGAATALTASHVVVGSLDYMAPEQFDGQAGPSSDVYSLACVFFQCLTGSTPFSADGLPALMRAHTSHAPPRPSQRLPRLGDAFDDVLRRALAKDPDERPASASAFALEIREAAGGPGTRPRRTSAEQEAEPVTIGGRARTGPTAPPRSMPEGASGPTELVGGSTVGVLEAPPEEPGGPVADDVTTTAGVTTPPPTAALGPPSPPSPPSSGGRGRRRGLLVLAALLVLAVVGALAVALVPDGAERTESPAVTGPASAAGPEAPPALPARSLDRPEPTGTIPVANGPETLAVTPDGQSAYVTATEGPPQLLVVDLTTGQTIAAVPTPGPPYFVGLSPDGEHAYVSIYDRTAGELVIGVMDARVNEFDRFVPTGQKAAQGSRLTWLFGFAVAPDGRLLVPNHNASVVSVVDPESGRPLAQIPTPSSPHWVALTPDGRRAYVTNHMPGQVTALDTATGATVAAIPIGPGTAPHSVAVSPDGRTVETVNYDSDTMTFIDPASNTVVATIPTGEEPQSVAFAPDGAHSYVVNEGANSVSVVSTAERRVTAELPVGEGASMIALAPDGRTAFVANKEGDSISVLRVGA